MSFAFSDNTVTLDVCGKSYAMNPYSDDVSRAIADYGKAVAREARDEDGASPEAVERMCAIIKDLVVALLGEGSYAVIFGGRVSSFQEHHELAAYLIAYVGALRSARTGMHSLNGKNDALIPLGE